MRLCLALGLALGLGLALALCLLCLLWPWPGPVGAAWVVLSGRFSTSFLGFGQVRLIHKDGGESFTACEIVSQICRFCVCCLNGWLGFGLFGSDMGELASPEFHFWKSMFCGLPQGLNFIFGNAVFVCLGWRELLCMCSWICARVRVHVCLLPLW